MPNECSKKCCQPKKKIYQGKAYLPDDHIQLISKYYQGANLNLNFTLDDDAKSDETCCRKKRRSRSRSRKRRRKKRKRKRCKCCKGHEDKCQVPKSHCGEPCCQPKPVCKDPCAPVRSNGCCGGASQQVPQCCPVKTSTCCCEKPPEPEPPKLCCCCGRPCVKKDDENCVKKDESNEKINDHQHTSCCCKCNKGEESDDKKGKSKNEKKPRSKEVHKKPPTPEPSSGSVGSRVSNVKQVYVTRKVSSMENSEAYGRYWYHRPPLENTIAQCDYPGSAGQRSCDVASRPHHPCSERFTSVYNTLQNAETGEPSRNTIARCLACKDPMCLLCKMNLCDCDCEKPNFVICNPCKHRLTPKPPKKCPPKKPKASNQPQQANNGCEEAMFLLPLLASMQASMRGNDNFQKCNNCC